jgi:hypothetical protein
MEIGVRKGAVEAGNSGGAVLQMSTHAGGDPRYSAKAWRNGSPFLPSKWESNAPPTLLVRCYNAVRTLLERS